MEATASCQVNEISNKKFRCWLTRAAAAASSVRVCVCVCVCVCVWKWCNREKRVQHVLEIEHKNNKKSNFEHRAHALLNTRFDKYIHLLTFLILNFKFFDLQQQQQQQQNQQTNKQIRREDKNWLNFHKILQIWQIVAWLKFQT